MDGAEPTITDDCSPAEISISQWGGWVASDDDKDDTVYWTNRTCIINSSMLALHSTYAFYYFALVWYRSIIYVVCVDWPTVRLHPHAVGREWRNKTCVNTNHLLRTRLLAFVALVFEIFHATDQASQWCTRMQYLTTALIRDATLSTIDSHVCSDPYKIDLPNFHIWIIVWIQNLLVSYYLCQSTKSLWWIFQKEQKQSVCLPGLQHPLPLDVNALRLHLPACRPVLWFYIILLQDAGRDLGWKNNS